MSSFGLPTASTISRAARSSRFAPMPESEPVLGRRAPLPASPEEAALDTVANPHPGLLYLVRFTCPEVTALCPVTAQPDYAHFGIDYVPEADRVWCRFL